MASRIRCKIVVPNLASEVCYAVGLSLRHSGYPSTESVTSKSAVPMAMIVAWRAVHRVPNPDGPTALRRRYKFSARSRPAVASDR